MSPTFMGTDFRYSPRVACFHVHGDAAGETHLTRLELPVKETYAGTVRGLNDIPATTMGMGEFVGRKPDGGMHEAPRRQFVVVLPPEHAHVDHLAVLAVRYAERGVLHLARFLPENSSQELLLGG